MTNSKSVKIPTWLVGILISTFIAVLGTVFYAGQTYGEVKALDQRLTRIENGVDQLWTKALDSEHK